MKVGEIWIHKAKDFPFTVKIIRFSYGLVSFEPSGDIKIYTDMCDAENLVYHFDGWTLPRTAFIEWYRKQYPQPGE